MSKVLIKVVIGVIVALVVCGALLYLVLHDRHSSPSEPVVQVTKEATTTPLKPAVTHEMVGTSVEGRSIDAYTYGTGATHLLFVGGMHGGYEWNSVLLAYEFMDYLEAHPDVVPANLSITVIPSANPDGVFKVIGKEGRFTLADAPTAPDVSGLGRFNVHGVDLNRNFDCHWKPESTWRSKKVSAGTSPFSEPESQAIRTAVTQVQQVAVVFWHSQSNAVYASECDHGILPKTMDIMKAYATAAGYPAVDSFDAYPVTGDSEGWLASIGIPAITVELKTHATVEWDKNLLGIQALIKYFTS